MLAVAGKFMTDKARIGVLALQGGYSRHIAVLRSLGVDAFELREPSDLEGISGVVLPGGESTTIGMLMQRRGLDIALPKIISNGLPVFGTCAGAILLAKQIINSNQYRMSVLDIGVDRNAYGSQVDSFECHLEISDTALDFKTEIEAVFIRAPKFVSIGPKVRVLATFGDAPVMVRQDNILAAAFHPELTQDSTVHRYFLEKVAALTLSV